MRLKIFLIIVIPIGFIFIAGYIFLKGAYSDWKPNKLQNLRKELCKLLNGEMRSTGCGIAGCVYKCQFPYRDDGQICQSSKECSGKCLVIQSATAIKKCKAGGDNFFDCSGQNLKTQCQKFPLANCEDAWEYDRGIVKHIYGECDL